MSPHKTVTRAILVLVFLVLAGGTWASDGPVEGSFWYVVDNVTRIEEGARFLVWVTLPPTWHGQEISVTAIEPDPVSVFEDSVSGNKVVEWLWEPDSWERLPEMQPQHFFFHYDFVLTEKTVGHSWDPAKVEPYDQSSELYQTYTQPATWLQTDGLVRDQALDIVGDEKNPGLQAKMIYDWVLESMTFVPGGEGQRDAASTLAGRRGDCGQFSNLITAMCRSLGIPARNVSTAWLDGGLHDLNEIYFPGYGWFPVDASLGQMLMPHHGGMTFDEVSRFMKLRGIPLDDPDYVFGHMPSGKMVISKGVNVRFHSPTLDKEIIRQRMRPGGAGTFPEGFISQGFNESLVHGGFFVFGEKLADDEAVHAMTHQRLAGSFFKEGLYEIVEDGCRQSLEQDADGVQSWINLGKVYMHKEEYYKAEAAFKRARSGVSVKRNEKAEALIWTHNYLGNCYDLLGHRKLAMKEYQVVIDLDDNFRGAVDYAKKYLERPFSKKAH